MDPVAAWLVALLAAFVVGVICTLVGFARSRVLGLVMLGLTLVVLGALLGVGYFWAVVDGHLTG